MTRFILFALAVLMYTPFSAIKDGILWSRTGAGAFKWNEHIVFQGERAVVFLLLPFIGFLPDYNLVSVGAGIWGIVWSFSFFHNGMYYKARDWITPDKEKDFKWRSNSTTSTAVLEFTYKQRLGMLFIGLTGMGWFEGIIFLVERFVNWLF